MHFYLKYAIYYIKMLYKILYIERYVKIIKEPDDETKRSYIHFIISNMKYKYKEKAK